MYRQQEFPQTLDSVFFTFSYSFTRQCRSQVYEPLLSSEQLAALEATLEEELCDGDAAKFRLGIKAMRLAGSRSSTARVARRGVTSSDLGRHWCRGPTLHPGQSGGRGRAHVPLRHDV